MNLKNAAAELAASPGNSNLRKKFCFALYERIMSEPSAWITKLRKQRKIPDIVIEEIAEAALSPMFERAIVLCETGRFDFNRSPEELEGYLFQLFEWKCLSVLRSRKRSAARLQTYGTEKGKLDDLTTLSPSNLSVLHNAMAALSPNDRLLLELMYLERLTRREIAERLKVSLKTVYVKIHRAKSRFEKQAGKKEEVG